MSDFLEIFFIEKLEPFAAFEVGQNNYNDQGNEGNNIVKGVWVFGKWKGYVHPVDASDDRWKGEDNR